MLVGGLTPDGGLHGRAGEAPTLLLRRLMVSWDFREAFVNRFCDLLNTVFQPAHTRGRIDAMAAVLEPEMAEHTRRWRAPADLAAWRANVGYLRQFADLRPGFVLAHLARRFGLGGTVRLTLRPADPAQGAIRVNTLVPAEPDGAPWSGE